MSRSTSRYAYVGLALTAVACAAALWLPVAAEALPCNFEYRYYSNSSYTTLVGRAGNRPQECGCGSYSIGTLTQWRQSGPSACLE